MVMLCFLSPWFLELLPNAERVHKMVAEFITTIIILGAVQTLKFTSTLTHYGDQHHKQCESDDAINY